MKQLIKILILFCMAITLSVSQLYAQRTVRDMLKPTFDSSQVVIAIIDTLYQGNSQNTQMAPQIAQPSNIIDYTLDQTRIAGDVPYKLGTTISGQVELVIPIETFASEYELAPQVAIRYNSQGGLTCVGRAWDIAGLSCIEPVNNNYFTDGNTLGRNHYSGPWALDGNRLILQETTDSSEIFLTQTGNIKVVREINTHNGFRVFLPDGSINNFDFSSGYYTKWYPSTYTALDGKEISYSYYNDSNLKQIKSIEYGEGRSLNFIYEDAENEQTSYIDGIPFVYKKKLVQIDVKCHENLLRQYIMTYRNDDITAPLVQVDMLDSIGNAVNPLCFYYQGDDASNESDSQTDKQMSAYFDFEDPEYYIAFRGKLDYVSEDDAVIIYPNKRNYYVRQRDRIRNDYNANDNLVISFNLNGYTSNHEVLTVGEGFVDAFCMNIDSQYGEELVMVNQNVYNSNLDHVQFNIYQHNIYGLFQTNTVDFYFNSLECDDHYSVWPAMFLTGDFTGDGRDEVLLCRTANPLGGGEVATVKMIDLEHNAITYSGNLDAFKLYVYDNQYSPDLNRERARNSDRLFASDLDGDGKLEMCVLNSSGLDIYQFYYGTMGNVMMTKSNYPNLKLSQAHDYDVVVGDVNGDRNTDLVFLPNVENCSVKAYLSDGDQHFTYKSIGIQSDDKTNLMCFDYNQDGQTDIVRYVKTPYMYTPPRGIHRPFTFIYSLKNGEEESTYRLLRTEPSILVPMNLFGQNSNMAMLSIKSGGLYDIHRCANPASMDALLIGVADSYGCISQMQYRQLYQSEYYAPGFNSEFPFTTYAGNMFVCSQMTKMAGNKIESCLSFSYNNATLHQQGLGFCGFRSIQTIDNVRGESSNQSFIPEKFGVPASVTSTREQSCYTYQTALSNDKRIKVLLTSVDKTDLITGVETSGAYTYDSYGNVLSESTSSGNLTKTVTNTYQNLDSGSNWIIGAELSHVETVTRDNQTITSGRTTKYNADWLPDTIITWRGSEQSPVSTQIVKYDSQKRPARIKTRAYSGTELKRYIDYQGTSRIPKGIRDEKGIYNSMVYGDFGVIQSNVKPELLVRPDENDFPIIPMDPAGSLGGSDGVNGHGPSVVIGPNFPDLQPLTTLYHYDTFGRQDTVTTPGGIQKTVTYSWVDDDSSDALIMVENKKTGHATSRVWFDALGRKVQSSQQRFDDRWSTVFYEYDDLGRLASESQPTLTTSPSLWTTYTYDVFDRLVEKEYPDEHVDAYSYSGLSITSTIDGVTSTRTFDESGNLVEVNDGGGRIEYTLRPDGQPSEIRVGGSISTTFGYDQYGRRTSINDPSAGCRTTTYDNNGNVQSETDARGQSVTSIYNEKGLLTSRTFSDGLSVTFAYDQWNAPTSMTGSNGRTKTWTYNDQRRLSTESIDGFKKTYSYIGNQISSVGYSKNNTYICSEYHNHTNGHLTSITLNTGDTIWTLWKQNSRFLPTKVGLGKLETSLSYDQRGNVTNRQTVFMADNTNTTKQNLAYSYDPETGNMSSRLDWLTMLRESFGYDGMNRLTDISLYDGVSCLSEQETLYDGKGNILSRADAGQYGYDPSLPYGIYELTSPGTSIPMRDQYLHFNAMQLPDTISENGYTATFGYYGDQTRAAMTVTGPEAYRFVCEYYDQQYNEFSKTVGNVTSYKSVLWLGGSPYSAPAVLLKNYGESNWQLVHVLRDNLGSITHVIDTTGIVLQELAYTAWGQLRDPLTASIYGPDNQPVLLLGRGYTGHEHLPWFGLINMNARLYDPAVGRFLNPDPIIQTPDNTQNFNRYSYCMNNPLRYVDEDGEFWWIVIGAIIGGTVNVVHKAISGDLHSFSDGALAFGVGALAGAAGGVVGGLVCAGVASTIGGVGFLAGAAGGAASSAISMPLLSACNTACFGDPFMSPQDYLIGIAFGAVLGGTITGTISAIQGRNFWTGNYGHGESVFSFRSGLKSQEIDYSYSDDIQSNKIAPTESKVEYEIPDRTLENFNKHFNSKFRHANLNLSQSEVSDKVLDFVRQNQGLLREGNNTFQCIINGLEKSVKVYLEGNTIRSINFYDGFSNRLTTNPIIRIGPLKW